MVSKLEKWMVSHEDCVLVIQKVTLPCIGIWLLENHYLVPQLPSAKYFFNHPSTPTAFPKKDDMEHCTRLAASWLRISQELFSFLSSVLSFVFLKNFPFNFGIFTLIVFSACSCFCSCRQGQMVFVLFLNRFYINRNKTIWENIYNLNDL